MKLYCKFCERGDKLKKVRGNNVFLEIQRYECKICKSILGYVCRKKNRNFNIIYDKKIILITKLEKVII